MTAALLDDDDDDDEEEEEEAAATAAAAAARTGGAAAARPLPSRDDAAPSTSTRPEQTPALWRLTAASKYDSACEWRT